MPSSPRVFTQSYRKKQQTILNKSISKKLITKKLITLRFIRGFFIFYEIVVIKDFWRNNVKGSKNSFFFFRDVISLLRKLYVPPMYYNNINKLTFN